MSYEPTNWQAGDTVTSAKLNKMEQGIAANSGILVVHQDDNGVLDKTWQEIYDAPICVIKENHIDNDYKTNKTDFVVKVYYYAESESNAQYQIDTVQGGYNADSANSYPILAGEE